MTAQPTPEQRAEIPLDVLARCLGMFTEATKSDSNAEAIVASVEAIAREGFAAGRSSVLDGADRPCGRPQPHPRHAWATARREYQCTGRQQ